MIIGFSPRLKALHKHIMCYSQNLIRIFENNKNKKNYPTKQTLKMQKNALNVPRYTDHHVHIALTKIERKQIEIVKNKEYWSLFKHSKDIEEVDEEIKRDRDSSVDSLGSNSPDDILSKCNFLLKYLFTNSSRAYRASA